GGTQPAPILIDEFRIAVGERVLPQRLVERAELLRQPYVVLIARCDEIASAHRYRALEILRKSEVSRVGRDLQPRIAAPVLVQNVEGSVARAIIERDDFDVAVGLREQ